MLGIVFDKRTISTLGQRLHHRKCQNSLEAFAALIASDRRHGCGPSGLPHIPLTSHLSDTTASCQGFLWINIFLGINYVLLTESILSLRRGIVSGKNINVEDWEKLWLIQSNQFGEICLADMLRCLIWFQGCSIILSDLAQRLCQFNELCTVCTDWTEIPGKIWKRAWYLSKIEMTQRDTQEKGRTKRLWPKKQGAIFIIIRWKKIYLFWLC